MELQNRRPGIGNGVNEKYKRRVLLNGLRSEFTVTLDVSRATEKIVTQEVSMLAIQKSRLVIN